MCVCVYIYIYIYKLTHFAICLKPTQHCESTVVQLKNHKIISIDAERAIDKISTSL